jgi:large repetitive protein
VLATITDPDTLATTSDVTATIDWGDGTPVGPLALQQIGVTPLTSPTPGEPIFDVFGSHTYAQETSSTPFLPLTFTIGLTTPGGASTTLTSPLGGGVTVLDAPLFGENSKVVTGSAGISTGMVPIASFLDANTEATSADFTTLPGSTEVFWGDGSSTRLSALNFTASSSANGVVFTIDAAHTYSAPGQYTISINVTDDGGQTTSIFAVGSIGPSPNSPSSQVQITGRHVPPAAAVDTLAGLSTHTPSSRKATTTHQAKPAVALSHTVQTTRVRDAAQKAIIAETTH